MNILKTMSANEKKHPVDWRGAVFVLCGVVILLIAFLWKWWLGVWLFLVICYGLKNVSYAILFGIVSLLAILGIASLF